MERLDINAKDYNSLEAAIHVNRYILAKEKCNNKVVLDIACGEGYGSKLLSNWGAKEVVGVDVSEYAVNVANEAFANDKIKYLVHDAEKIGENYKNYFDLIISLETIEHLHDPISFLNSLKLAAKKDAEIIISCPNDYFYFPNDSESNEFHVKKYTFEDFQKLIETVFKKNVNYMMGTYCSGYMNFSNNGQNGTSQKDMINFKTIESAFVPLDKKITNNDGCYYIACINCDLSDTSTVFPYSYDTLVEEYRKKINELYEISSENILLKGELSSNQESSRRLTILNEILAEEKLILQNKINSFMYENNQLRYYIKNPHIVVLSKFKRLVRKVFSYVKK